MSSNPLMLVAVLAGGLFILFIAAIALRKILTFVLLLIAVFIGSLIAWRLFHGVPITGAPSAPHQVQTSAQ